MMYGNSYELSQVMHLAFTRCHFWPQGTVVACVRVCVCVPRHSRACPRNNLCPVQSKLTKFGPEEQNTLVKIAIVLGMIFVDLQGNI